MQQRQSIESPHDNAATAPQHSPRRTSLLITGASALVLALFVAGCPEPGDLDDPGMYPADPNKAGSTGGSTAGGGTGGSNTAGGSAGGSACETPCLATALKACTICHSSQPALQNAKLDLQSPGMTARLKDQPATHLEVLDSSTCPTGDKLIDSANPAQSWFLKKLVADFGTCGLAMPVGAPLTMSELDCMKEYVNCVAGGM